MTREYLIERISQAIAQMEGFYLHDSIARRCANPGNLRKWKGTKVYRPNPNKPDNVYAMFPDATAGFKALGELVGQYIDGKYTDGHSPTLNEMFSVYAPSADNNTPLQYAAFVASHLNVSAIIPLDSLITPPLNVIADKVPGPNALKETNDGGPDGVPALS